jgi:hypothetical protein
MTSPRNSHPNEPAAVPDGGEEYYDYGEVVDEHNDEYVEHYPDPFVDAEPGPLHDDYLPEYDQDPHLLHGLDAEPGPRWGFEEDSARPRGPPCENCGEYTRADSFGWSPDTGETVDSAVCDDCGFEWSSETGWVDLEADGA